MFKCLMYLFGYVHVCVWLIYKVMIMCICENSLFVYRYECVSLRVLYANVYVVFRHRCAFVKRSCVCVTLCIGLVWWGGKWIDGRKWLQTYIINFSWKGRVFGDCKVSFLFPLGTHYSEWMDVKPRLEGLSLRSGLKLWLNTTRTTALWIVRHCLPYVPLPLSLSSSLLLVREQQKGDCLV